MITLVSVMLIGLVFGIFKGLKNNKRNEFKKFVGRGIVGGMVGVVTGFIAGLILALTIGLFLDTSYIVTKTEEIVDLKSASGSSGRFFIGTGEIDFNTYYFYYIKVGNKNSYQLQKLKVDDNVIIIEEEGNNIGILITRQEYFVNQDNYLIAAPLPRFKLEFHIPYGSISRNFSL